MLEFFLKGGPLMWPLLGCSIVAMTVIIERAIFWIKEARSRDTKIMHRVLHLVEHGLYEEAKTAGEKSKDYLIRIFLLSIPHQHLSLEGALEMSALKEINRMKQYLPVLDTIITVSPLLGILGTVAGIFSSFNVLGQSAILSPDTVARGIAEAIITTIAGLGIAIPTLIAYNYFCSKVEKAATEIEAALSNFKIIYQKGKNRQNETVAVS
jgi:biopolymer transport protein ExbB